MYKFYSYVYENEKYRNVNNVGYMDDDVVLCPELFKFLKTKGINNQSYAGMFYHLARVKDDGIGKHPKVFSDEMFVILGRTLMNQILSKEYCYDTSEETCASRNQRFDTNFGGESLGLWLSSVKDVHILPLNDVALHMDEFVELGIVKHSERYNELKYNALVHHLTREYLSLIHI